MKPEPQPHPRFNNGNGAVAAPPAANPVEDEGYGDDDNSKNDGCGLIGCLTGILIVLLLLAGIKWAWKLLWM